MTCRECGKPLARRNKSGLCRKHIIVALNTDPAIARRRLEGIRRDSANRREEKRRLFIEIGRKARENPEHMARMRAQMRSIQPLSHTPEVIAKIDLAERGRKTSETKMAWCPPAYRAEYRKLIRTDRLTKAEAQAIIFAQIERDRAHLSPFEKQDQALARGAGIIANDNRFFGQIADYGERKWELGR